MSNLVAKSDFTALKAEFDKLDIKRLINVPASFNNFKTKVDDLDVGKLKTVPTDLKIHDVVNKEVAKNTKFNTPKEKVNKLDAKFLMLLF